MRSNNRSLSKYLFDDVLPRFLNIYRALSRVIIPRNNNVFGKTPALGSARCFRERAMLNTRQCMYHKRWEIFIAIITPPHPGDREKDSEGKTRKIQQMAVHCENGRTSRWETERLKPLLVPRSLLEQRLVAADRTTFEWT